MNLIKDKKLWQVVVLHEIANLLDAGYPKNAYINYILIFFVAIKPVKYIIVRRIVNKCAGQGIHSSKSY